MMIGFKSFLAIAASGFFSLAASAYAADKCYEDVPVPATWNCGTTASKSADFTTGCKLEPARVDQKEVECPGQWVNVTAPWASQAVICSRAGLSPAKIDGAICASGFARPTSGTGYNRINYQFGTKGSAGVGGTKMKQQEMVGWEGGSDNGYEYHTYYYYCWGAGRNNDYSEGDVAVAMACK